MLQASSYRSLIERFDEKFSRLFRQTMQSSNEVSEETSSPKLKISDSKAFIKMVEISDPTGFGRELAN